MSFLVYLLSPREPTLRRATIQIGVKRVRRIWSGARDYPARRTVLRPAPPSRNRRTASIWDPSGSLSPRSNLANLAGSTLKCAAASFCDIPSDVLCLTSLSPSVFASGSGPYPRNAIMAGMYRSFGWRKFARRYA